MELNKEKELERGAELRQGGRDGRSGDPEDHQQLISQGAQWVT